jgi:hypothetical protein
MFCCHITGCAGASKDLLGFVGLGGAVEVLKRFDLVFMDRASFAIVQMVLEDLNRTACAISRMEKEG